MPPQRKYLIPPFIAFFLLALAIPAYLQPVTGTWTANNWLFKLALGDKGPAAKTQLDTGLNQVDARLAKEIWVGDPNCGTTLQGAITTISTSSATLHVPPGTYTISTSITVPANIILKPENGALFSVSSGQVLTISGPLDAGPFQIFSGAGTVALAGPIPFAYPEWWGSGSIALQGALNSGIHKILLTQSLYQMSSMVTVSTPCLEIIGSSPAVFPEGCNTPSAVTIQATASMDKMFYVLCPNSSANNAIGFSIKNVKLDGNSLANHGVYITDARYWKSEDTAYINFLDYALFAGGQGNAWSGRAIHNFFSNDVNGIYMKGDNMVCDQNIFESISGTSMLFDATWCNFSATRNKFDGCPLGIVVNACWSMELNNNYFEANAGSNMTHIRLGQTGVIGMLIMGGSVSNNMFSYDGAWDATHIGVDIQQISNVTFFGNYGSEFCGVLFKNNTGGASNGSWVGVNFINSPSSTVYIDSVNGFASVLDNTGNQLVQKPINANGATFTGFVGSVQASGNGVIGGKVTGDTSWRWWIDNTGSMVVGGNGTNAPATIMWYGYNGSIDASRYNPLSSAPSNPTIGMQVLANRQNWDPLSKGSGGPYFVWYDGNNWVSLTSQ